ncbi:MAG TPA: SPOR domain-containing protein, partial [Cryomorphaceae bacterium]|nr:SPOR domain-containing protein [Cryomorphaceae bacterium]
LYDYDCVILPQLGGFVTNYKPARIDESKGIALPPRKDIGFNRNLMRSDGLLEKSLSDGQKITFEEAGEAVKKQVAAYWETLNSGEKVRFNKIGLLYIDDDKNLQFKPSDDVNYLKTSFGFESFALPEPRIVQKEPVEVVAEDEHAEIHYDKIRKSRSIVYVAAAAILPFIAMSAYIGFTTNFKSPTEISAAEILPFSRNRIESRTYEMRKSESPVADDSDIDGSNFPENENIFPYSFLESKIDSTGVWVDLRKTEQLKTESDQVELSGKYHIIAGCFGEKTNAETYVERLKMRGYGAGILDYHKNLYRVKIVSFKDYQTALGELRSLRENEVFPNAWLLKKPLNS